MTAPYDLAFARAVRQAARGLHATPNIDPEAEAAPLAAILRKECELDAQGLELMAMLVTGMLRKQKYSTLDESNLSAEVRRAGLAWGKEKKVKREDSGAELAAILRSGEALGPGERALLADLFTGELRQGTSRPSHGVGSDKFTRVVLSFKDRIESGVPRKNALSDTALEFAITTRTVEVYLAACKERRRAIEAQETLRD